MEEDDDEVECVLKNKRVNQLKTILKRYKRKYARDGLGTY